MSRHDLKCNLEISLLYVMLLGAYIDPSMFLEIFFCDENKSKLR
ncbi:hypothetical protein T08_16811 [Trichinella sp. T8]|nr:hypothetical protein T08_16811 [Trichinella sp. T8]